MCENSASTEWTIDKQKMENDQQVFCMPHSRRIIRSVLYCLVYGIVVWGFD
jgi:hypothetical protein